jgi:hypothetical protein
MREKVGRVGGVELGIFGAFAWLGRGNVKNMF